MMRPVAIGIAFAAFFLASAGSCAPESAEGTKRKSGAERLVKKNGAARMKAEQEIQRFRDGEPFHGNVSAFTAPDAQAIDLLAQELRNNPKPKVREQVVKALVRLGTESDPDKLLTDRRILASLFEDGSIHDDCAYMKAMDEVAASAPASVLREFETTLARLASRPPVSGLFLVIAKAKATKALPSLQARKDDPSWNQEESFAVALAALGDKALERRFIDRFADTRDPKEKMEAAKPLGWIGTPATLKALASEMRSPLVFTIPATFRQSVRPAIAKAIQYNYPRDRFLLVVNSDADYERIEKFCEKEFGTTWEAPRPPFLNIQPLAPTP